jgi:hypothetical protein
MIWDLGPDLRTNILDNAILLTKNLISCSRFPPSLPHVFLSHRWRLYIPISVDLFEGAAAGFLIEMRLRIIVTLFEGRGLHWGALRLLILGHGIKYRLFSRPLFGPLHCLSSFTAHHRLPASSCLPTRRGSTLVEFSPSAMLLLLRGGVAN